MGTKLSPGTSLRLGMVATPIDFPSTKTFWETVPSSMVMFEGFGMKTCPLMLVPSFAGIRVIVMLRTSKPLSPLRPGDSMTLLKFIVVFGNDPSLRPVRPRIATR